jgi:pimeloyl-ACP methyl ester carboxylesterase
MSQVYAAALLAAHGYPSLSVAYFDWPGLPSRVERIPLEYFETAVRILAAQPGTDPAHVLALGYSLGSEAALLAADYFPQVFHGAIVYSPSSFADPSQNDPGQPAWMLDGKGVVNVPIPEDDISGPVLALAGGDDALVTDAGHGGHLPLPAHYHRGHRHPRRHPGGGRGRPAGRLVEGPRPARPALPVALDDGALVLRLGRVRAAFGNRRPGWPQTVIRLGQGVLNPC